MKYPYLWYFVLFALITAGCSSKQKQSFGSDIDTSQEYIRAGRETFDKLCASCHNFDQDGIGPDLSGLTRSVETKWIKDFIRDPQKMILAKDPRATALFKKYKVYMQGFPNLSEIETENIISYLHTFESKGSLKNDTLIPPIKNPIVDTIPSSGLVVPLELVGQVPASQDNAPMARINKMECTGKSGRVFINDLRGSLYELREGKFRQFLSLNAYFDNFIHQPGLATGFGSFAFHPDFDQNGLFYTTHAEQGGLKKGDFSYETDAGIALQWVVAEWKMEAPAAETFMGTHRELMRVDFVSGVHGMQEIAFNPNVLKEDPDFGMLYMK